MVRRRSAVGRPDPAAAAPPLGSGAAERSGAFRFTVPERNAIYEHAARQAAAAADHVRRCARGDPADAADADWAAADTLYVAARALGNPALRRAADSYDRAARARYGQIPGPPAKEPSCVPRPGCWHWPARSPGRHRWSRPR